VLNIEELTAHNKSLEHYEKAVNGYLIREKAMPFVGYIYGLEDPLTDVVQYVGQSRSLAERFKGYVRESSRPHNP
jgi:hypothetical protein